MSEIDDRLDELADEVEELSPNKVTISDKLNKFQRDHKQIIGGSFFALFIVLTVCFLVLGLIIALEGTSNKDVVWGLFATNIILALFIAIGFYSDKKWAIYLSVFLSIVRFILALAMLLHTETSGNVSCANSSMYKVYMATHSFNIILLFFGIIAAMLPEQSIPRINY